MDYPKCIYIRKLIKAILFVKRMYKYQKTFLHLCFGYSQAKRIFENEKRTDLL